MEDNITTMIAEGELGVTSTGAYDITVSSPFRNDSNPSFRCYLSKDGGFYDWGSGQSYTPVSLVMALKGMSYNEAIDYIRVYYGVDLSTHDRESSDAGISSKLKILKHNGYSDYKQLERCIARYFKGDTACLDREIPDRCRI